MGCMIAFYHQKQETFGNWWGEYPYSTHIFSSRSILGGQISFEPHFHAHQNLIDHS